MIDKYRGSRYIISDLHIGHKNIHKFRSHYQATAEQHWEAALVGLRSVPKRATLFLLGDIASTKEHLALVKNIPCKNKILICGNHDVESGITMKDLADTYEKVYSLSKYKGFWQQHAPVHTSELRGLRQIHGHTHYNLMLDEEGDVDTRYINTCVEYTGYIPLNWEYVVSGEYTEECKKVWTDYKTKGIIKTE